MEVGNKMYEFSSTNGRYRYFEVIIVGGVLKHTKRELFQLYFSILK